MSTPNDPERTTDDQTANGDGTAGVGRPQPGAPWGAPPPPMPKAPGPVPPQPSAPTDLPQPTALPAPPPPPAPEEDATMPSIHEPYGAWLSEADRAVGASNGAPSSPPSWAQTAGRPPKTEEQRKHGMKTKRRIIVWVIVVLLVGALIAAAFVTRSVLAKGKYGPQHQVEGYLQALVDGKASAATKLMDPNVTTAERALLTDEVYQVTEGRPTDFSITSTEINGSSATVKADVVQDGKTDKVTFTLVKDGKRDVVFDSWRLDSGPRQGVAVGTVPTKVKVNGVEVELGKAAAAAKEGDDSGSELPLLPGEYTFTAPKGSSYVSYGDNIQVDVRLNGEDPSQDPVSFSTSYTEKVYTDAAAQIQKKIGGCDQDKEMFVESCLAASWEDTGYAATLKIKRAWVGTPLVTIESEDFETAVSGEDMPGLHGNLSATIDAQLHVEARGRDDAEDKDGYYTDATFNPFSNGTDSMVFPIKIDGNKLTVGGLDQIDRYDPNNISADNQRKYSQYKQIGQ